MKIKLVKETSADRSVYYVTLNGQMRAGSVCDSVAEAIQMYESVKFEATGKRTEVLMEEEL